ncbi:MAG: LruC domain-containing protein [Lentimicrobiaceae bacterium]|nr:LruC domain-containing protein [Lentimicrobiaceae bacterium]
MKSFFYKSKNKLLTLSLLIVSGTILLFSCSKNDSTSGDTPSQFKDLNISQNFDFQSFKEVAVTINVNNTSTGEKAHIIKIYQDNPGLMGKLIETGITNAQFKYVTKIRIPSYLTELYIQNASQDGINEFVAVPIKGKELNYTFTALADTYKGYKTVGGDPGCSNGCTRTISTSVNSITIEEGEHVCLTGNLTGNITFKGAATLVVCGTATVQNININGNFTATIYVSGNGVYTMSSSLNLNKIYFYNYGILQISGQVNAGTGSIFENYGTANIIGINVNNNDATVLNAGIMNVSADVNNNGTITNQSLMRISAHLNNNGQGVFTNECHLEVSGNYNQNNIFTNNGYVVVTGTTTLNGTSQTNLGNGSQINTANLMVNATINGPSTGCGRINISGTTRINGSGVVRYYTDLCDANGIESNTGTIATSVTFCQCYVPVTSCNPSGSGSPPTNDSDGDGISDNQDEYPNDPDRAFNSYYPNATDFASVAFEDLWTGTGDYDFNDLVIAIQYKMVKNAQNEYVDIVAKYKIRADGATLNNGFGIVLNTVPANIQSVTGCIKAGTAITLDAKGYESGHANETVIIPFDAVNTILGGGMLNTIRGGATVVTEIQTITINFSSPQASIGSAPFNPFIFINQERGKEVHLKDQKPTEFVTSSYFGTFDDASVPSQNKYYCTATGLPWAIEIPVDFAYPVEMVDILQTYLHFAEWAQSGGTLYPDWYLNNQGYRNTTNIY